ncbi:DegV family protein [Diplocloster hominis]|uniref:DegV family protein n=1 Tax=Diplocloster hominis TaxID=3079010 RepID=UPI0031BB3C41
MSYKIVVDSCGELPENLKKDPHFETVSLSMDVDEYHIVDDETFDQADFLKKVAASPNCPKSSCPSPKRYVEAYEGEAEHVYAVTLSAELSGSHNSAVLAKKLYKEEHDDKKIWIFNSRSASVGETLTAMKIQQCEEAGMPFEKVVKTVEAYLDSMNTFFVLESLETLRKNGRLTGVKALVASALNIKPVMGATDEGTIYQLGQARGVRKALMKMVEQIGEKTPDIKNRVLGIAHCNCPERALEVKKEIIARYMPKGIFVVDTAGISSLYANDGGIIIAV